MAFPDEFRGESRACAVAWSMVDQLQAGLVDWMKRDEEGARFLFWLMTNAPPNHLPSIPEDVLHRMREFAIIGFAHAMDSYTNPELNGALGADDE